MTPPLAPSVDDLHEAKASFVTELARRLHSYGTSAQRLEGAVVAVARRLGLECEIWSNPTGMILSFADPVRGPAYGITRVVRLEPGDQNLGRLARADAIAEDVLAGRSSLADGHAALLALDRPSSRRRQVLTALCFGLSSASVAGLISGGWANIATAAVLGWIIGALFMLGAGRPRLSEALEAIAALVATLLAAAVASFVVALSLKTVIIAALIVLMPGLALTTAVAELSSQHLVSGTARFAGAMMSLLKLTFGTVAAMQIVQVLGWQPQEDTVSAAQPLLQLGSLLVAAFAFAVLFQCSRRDYLLAMAAAVVGYGLVRLGTDVFGLSSAEFPGSVFFAGMGVAALSNAYGRWRNRPGALIRVPGIILLVPGSVGFRSLNFVMERDVLLGLDTAFLLISALVALVAGLLFGNLLVPARRNL
ncbi:MAG TPA: threonine/serine exporter family protein [Arenimonas sp.]|nr:threonine/serine exporter family protein [Arenimonas sp.]